MKTFKTASIAFAIVFLLGCSKETPNEQNESPSKIDSNLQVKSNEPSILISLDKAKEQLDYYNAAHPAEVGNEYAMRTWISIEDLKAYIAYIENESKEKGIEVSGVDIIRSQYKKAEPGSPNPNNEVYSLTLMLAPTYAKGNSNVAFDPIYSEHGKPKDLKDLFQEIKNDSMNSNTPSPGGSSIANSLRSCPNMCP